MEKEKNTKTRETKKKLAAVKSPHKSQSSHEESNEQIAVIFIRNTTGSSKEVIKTLRMLRLYLKNTCAVFKKSPSMMGMLTKVKDYTTYGPINEETIKLLEEKRGQKDENGEIKKHFHLHPPRGGYERKGIKRPFMQGGALGYRGEKINELIKKML